MGWFGLVVGSFVPYIVFLDRCFCYLRTHFLMNLCLWDQWKNWIFEAGLWISWCVSILYSCFLNSLLGLALKDEKTIDYDTDISFVLKYEHDWIWQILVVYINIHGMYHSSKFYSVLGLTVVFLFNYLGSKKLNLSFFFPLFFLIN